jgi:cytochrome c peroxidase
MRIPSWIFLGAVPLSVAACALGDAPDPGPKPVTPHVDVSPEEAAFLASMSPLPALPADPTNAFADDPGAAELGHLLVFDLGLSGPSPDGTMGAGQVACWSCHSSEALDDKRSESGVSHGTGWTPRNSLSLLNSSYYAWSGWGGKFDSQWSLALAAIENPKVMNGTRLGVVHRIFEKYPGNYEPVFGPLPIFGSQTFPPSGKPKASPSDPDGAWETLSPELQAEANRIFVNAGKAIGAYLRQLVSGDSAFDRWAAGSESAMTESAKRGFRLFVGRAGCVGCHSGPLLSDGEFHNTGVQQTGDHVPAEDLGRYSDVQALLASPWRATGDFSDARATGKLDGLAPVDAMRGEWRTKSLRNLTRSGPYMHAGQIATLEAAIQYEASGGVQPCSGGSFDPKFRPVALAAADVADLAAFLGSLESVPVRGALRNPPASTPPPTGGW